MTPTGSSEAPRSRSILPAPSSTTTRPRAGVDQRSQSLKLGARSLRVRKVVPMRSPRTAASRVPSAVPSQIVTGTPELLAICAATTLLRIPPEPKADVREPMS